MKYYAVEKKNEENLYELIQNDLRILLRKNTEQYLWYVTFLCKKEERRSIEVSVQIRNIYTYLPKKENIYKIHMYIQKRNTKRMHKK